MTHVAPASRLAVTPFGDRGGPRVAPRPSSSGRLVSPSSRSSPASHPQLVVAALAAGASSAPSPDRDGPAELRETSRARGDASTGSPSARSGSTPSRVTSRSGPRSWPTSSSTDARRPSSTRRRAAERRHVLERAAGLTAEEAKAELVAAIENQAKRDAASLVRDIEHEARTRARSGPARSSPARSSGSRPSRPPSRSSRSCTCPATT